MAISDDEKVRRMRIEARVGRRVWGGNGKNLGGFEEGGVGEAEGLVLAGRPWFGEEGLGGE